MCVCLYGFLYWWGPEPTQGWRHFSHSKCEKAAGKALCHWDVPMRVANQHLSMCVIFVCARYLFHSQPSAPACNLYDSPLPRTRWRVNSHLPSPPRCHSVLLSPFSLIALDASHYDHNLGHIFIFWGSCYRNFLEKTTCSSKATTKSSEEQELSNSNHLFSSAAFNLKCQKHCLLYCSHYEYLYCI